MAVGGRTIDVVKANGELSDCLESSLPGGEQLFVHLVAEAGDEAVHAVANFFQQQFARWRGGLGLDLQLVATLAETVERGADVTGGKNAEVFSFYISTR